MQQDTVLKAENLCKSYVKGVLVNDNVSLSLGRGEIFGLLGPNGAGKTTFVKQVIGLAKPDSGRIAIDGVDVVASPGYARQACSFQAQVQAPISGLSTLEAIELAGQIRGGRHREVHERAMGLIDRLELGEWKKTMGATLAVVLGASYFDFDLSLSPLAIPAVILISLSSTFLGYSMAFAVPKPMMAQVLTQIIIFAVMLFSPIMYPAEQLPGWLRSVHQVLPVQYMADLVRGTLTDLEVNLGLAFGVVGAWFGAGFAATWMLVNRRQ